MWDYKDVTAFGHETYGKTQCKSGILLTFSFDGLHFVFNLHALRIAEDHVNAVTGMNGAKMPSFFIASSSPQKIDTLRLSEVQ